MKLRRPKSSAGVSEITQQNAGVYDGFASDSGYDIHLHFIGTFEKKLYKNCVNSLTDSLSAFILILFC